MKLVACGVWLVETRGRQPRATSYQFKEFREKWRTLTQLQNKFKG